MLASFSTALSALTADETAINVVGNNLANLNTPGFKDTVVSFSDLVTQSLGGGSRVLKTARVRKIGVPALCVVTTRSASTVTGPAG